MTPVTSSSHGTGAFVVELSGATAYVDFDRPRVLNALNRDQRVGLTSILRKLNEDDAVKAIVIGGKGGNFSAGQDQKESATMDSTGAAQRIEDYVTLFDTLRRVQKPVIGRVEGYAAGAGLQVALLCDVRIATPQAKLGMTELGIGSAAITASGLLWPLVGDAVMRRLILMGDFVSAEEALRLGLVTEVVPADRICARVQEVADLMGGKTGSGMQLTKDYWRMITEDLFVMTAEEARSRHAHNYSLGALTKGAQKFVARKG